MKSMTLVGDSMLARLNRDDEKGYLSLFQKYFSEIALSDLSCGGTDILFGLKQILDNDIQPESTVFIMFGTNDAASWKQVPIDRYEDTYRKVLDVLVQKELKVVLITPPPVNTAKQSSPGRSNEELNKYACVVHKISKDYDTGLIDLYEIIDNEMKNKDVHSDDGVHLNRVGNTLLLEQMKNF